MVIGIVSFFVAHSLTFASASDFPPPTGRFNDSVTVPLRYTLGAFPEDASYDGPYARQGFDWVFSKATFQQPVDIIVPLSQEDESPPLCLRDVNIRFEEIEANAPITIKILACVINTTITFRDIRSGPIPRWRSSGFAEGVYDTPNEAETLFAIVLNLQNSVANSSFVFSEIVGPTLESYSSDGGGEACFGRTSRAERCQHVL